MNNDENELQTLFLLPGGLIVTSDHSEIVTVLGSCVAVVIYDQHAGIAGMVHYLLASPNDPSDRTNRYGSVAIPALVQGLEELGGNCLRSMARVYGGANVLGDVDVGMRIGVENVKLANEMLAQLKIPIVEQLVGGTVGRRISFRTDSYAVAHQLMLKRGSQLRRSVNGG